VRTTDLSIHDFTLYVSRVRCITLLHYHVISPMKLEEVSAVRRLDLDSPGEFDTLGDARLVWYRNEGGERVFWNDRGAVPYTLRELVATYANEPMDESVRQMVEGFREGFRNGIEIVTVRDTILGERIVVDGVKRAAALYFLLKNEPETLARIWQSPHQVSIIDFASPAASMLFPCDFINICRDHAPDPGTQPPGNNATPEPRRGGYAEITCQVIRNPPEKHGGLSEKM
jgi:hypothetical protein